MKSKTLFYSIFLLLGMLFSATTTAALLNFNFTHGGFDEGWVVSGSFSGEDLNNDGILGSSNQEVTSFKFQFSQNGVVFPQFNVDTGGGFGIAYVLDGGPLGDNIEEIISVTDFPDFGDVYQLVPVGGAFPLALHIINSGPDIFSSFSVDDGVINANGFSGVSANSTEFAMVTPAMSTVPVPSAVWLFASALFGLFNIKRIQPLSGTQQKI